MPRDRVLVIKLTEKEQSKILAMAERFGLPASTWARQQLLGVVYSVQADDELRAKGMLPPLPQKEPQP